MRIDKFIPHFAYIVGGWVQKEGKMCLRNKSMAPNDEFCTKGKWKRFLIEKYVLQDPE